MASRLFLRGSDCLFLIVFAGFRLLSLDKDSILCYFLTTRVLDMAKEQKMIRFLVPLEDAIKLEQEAKKQNLSVSAFIRLLIKQWSGGIRFEKRTDKEVQPK